MDEPSSPMEILFKAYPDKYRLGKQLTEEILSAFVQSVIRSSDE
jgi:hypothetical protein